MPVENPCHIGRFLRLLVVPATLLVAARLTASGLENGFSAPPREARARVLWMWMNGNVTADGITRDLEAMKRVGLGGALVFNIGEFIPQGPVAYGGPEWQELMLHAARECDRLGLDLAMHNSPGWSSSGGPWITPENAMRQLVWSETFTTSSGDGSPLKLDLPQPLTHLGHYREIRVLAFPTLPGDAAATEIPAALSDRNLATTIDAGRDNPIDLTFESSVEVRAATLLPIGGGSAAGYEISVSDDGKNYRTVTTHTPPEPRSIGDVPVAVSFEATRARHWRIKPAAKSKRIAELALHGAPRIDNWDTKAGYHLKIAGENPLPAEIPPQFAIKLESVIDLTRNFDPATGRLTWTAPAGDWTILRFGHTASGRENIAAPETGVGLECDKLSPHGAEAHFRGGLQPLIDKLGPLAGKTFSALEVDSYEVGFQNWTEGFEKEFATRNGYDIVSFLPAMTGRFVGGSALSEKFLWDLRRTFADMVSENYYGRLRELAKPHGIDLYIEPYGAGPGPYDELQIANEADMPMGEFWARSPWDDNSTLKLAASSANTRGHALVGAEAFTGMAEQSRWLEHPYALKSVGDTAFSFGVNRLLFHRYAMQPHPDAVPGMTMGPWGIHYDRTCTWFEQSAPWIEYLARSQFMLQQGKHVADVLYYTGEGAPQRSRRTVPELPYGYTFDAIDTATLLSRTSVRDGRIVLPDGANFRLLVLPADLAAITPPLARHLEKLADAGATLVLGSRPTHSPSLRETTTPVSELTRLWDRKAANIITGKPLADALGTPDFAFHSSRHDSDIVWHHRSTGDAEIYFVANRRRRVEDLHAIFRITGLQPEIWNAETGARMNTPAFVSENGHTRLPLHLDPSGSVFVVFRKPATGAKPIPPPPVAPESELITNTFTVTVWINPETDILYPPRESTDRNEGDLGKSYVFSPRNGDASGPGHAVAGIAAGRNGVFVIERDSKLSPAVLAARLKLSGWTHLALVYRNGVPSLYLNGRHVRDGLKTSRTVHPGINLPPPASGAFPPHFEGDMTEPRLFPEALDAGKIAALAKEPPPAPDLPPGTLESSSIDSPWQVTFPPGLGAPPSITLAELQPLQLHADPGVRHFAGTAVYKNTFTLDAASSHRLELDLGRVAVIAEVLVNGKSAGILWKEPYRADIGPLVKPGENTLEIRVTTLWPNRLIGDEALPVENEYDPQTKAIKRLPDWYLAGKPKPAGGRTTFTTWQHFAKDAPLTESGLRGPVRILVRSTTD
jgi:alpha-L-rhamnosidase/Concanavalin A-like lectin/glucanases superfamily